MKLCLRYSEQNLLVGHKGGLAFKSPGGSRGLSHSTDSHSNAGAGVLAVWTARALRKECSAMEVEQVIRVVQRPPLAQVGLIECRETCPAEGWGLFCPRRYRDSTVQWCAYPRSCQTEKAGIAPWKRSAWQSGGWLTPCATTSWGTQSPSVWMKDTWITLWYLALQPFTFKVIHSPGHRWLWLTFALARVGQRGRVGSAGCYPGLSRAVEICGVCVQTGRGRGSGAWEWLL
ncbi:uncharacterized protein LOC114479609 [Gouania willdenowi]|uniref:uncharacterized protein LOC114479609 n=1 Tax=Gouania willdenowi TaxID=441366 RepID=UPI00105516F6|nr:uncharacterized protein LOC114479609 [Gouania willdenowi]